MKQLFYLILMIILVAGCQNRYEPTPEELERQERRLEETLEKIRVEDSIEDARKREERLKRLERQRSTSRTDQSKRSSQGYESDEYDGYDEYDEYDEYETDEDDNMRGFDPVNEDDLEDNGMSRYMENNDESGWY